MASTHVTADEEFSVSLSEQATSVSLPAAVWRNVLENAGDHLLAERVSVALYPARATSKARSVLDTLACWATKANVDSQTGLVVPSAWSRVCPWLRASAHVSVKAVKLIQLSSVVLLALDTSSYASATRRSAELQQKLAGEILRDGQVAVIEDALSYRVVLSEPVMQGLATATTRFVVLPPTEERPPASPSMNSDDEFDISEAFLASTLVDASTLTRSTSSAPLENSMMAHTADVDSQTQNAPRTGMLECAALTEYIEETSLVPRPAIGEDDECRVYLRPSELAALGLFSGARVVVTGAHPRLARAYSLPLSIEGSRNAVGLLPPAFFFNLLREEDRSRSSVPLQIQLLQAEAHVLPIASVVTVSRVCSPITVDRQYQPLFLQSLKVHFESRQRCLRTGDLIAVAIDASQAQQQISNGSEKDEAELEELPGISQKRFTDVVYFQISGLDVDTSALPPSATVALEDRMARGSLGAFVDPQTTKLIQSGTCQSLVPAAAAAQYLGAEVEPATPGALRDQPLLGKLLEHIRATLRIEARAFDLPLSTLIRSSAHGTGKRTLARWAAAMSGLHLLEIDCYDLIGETDVKTEGSLRARFDKAISCAPCVFVMRHIEALARKTQTVEQGQEPAIVSTVQECLESAQAAWKASGHPTLIVATTAVAERIPTTLLGCFKMEFVIEAPAETQRLSMLETLLKHDALAADVSLRGIAVQTAALVASDLVDLVARSRTQAIQRVRATLSVDISPADVHAAGFQLTSRDFGAALDEARASYSESIGAPKIPNVTWDDVGGLASVKREILDTVQLPLEQPELFADGLKKRSGILLYGPPGTGKTLLAKAVATSCSLNFFSVKGPELLNMYIGESEANVRRVFQRARDAKPCVIFFDELDSVAPKRGNQGDSGGVMDRIVSQLLAELDGMSDGHSGADVFVIGATNRPDLLDPALLRPGRFDRMLYLGVSDTHEAQLRILEALTRKFRLSPGTDLARIAEQCPYNYTGADFYALCSDAMLKAMSRKAEAVEKRVAELNAEPPHVNGKTVNLTPQYYLAELARPEDIEILVAQEDFELALRELVPSVSEAEMDHYAIVQQRFSGKTASRKAEVNGNVEHVSKGKGKAR